ncbi:hypothetical protein FRC10_007794 [Ceratobasidium sp. 414]|nr:hypothetical protein FRC10_007794 [Ceratobasidium sp. 414]
MSLTPGQMDEAMYMIQWLSHLRPDLGETGLATVFVNNICKPELHDEQRQAIYRGFMEMMARLRAWVISRDAVTDHARQAELLIQQANEIRNPHGWPRIIGTFQLTMVSLNANSPTSRTPTLTPSPKSAPTTSKRSSQNSSKTTTHRTLIKLMVCKDIHKKLKARKLGKSPKIKRFHIIHSKKVPMVAASLKNKRTPYNLRSSRLR